MKKCKLDDEYFKWVCLLVRDNRETRGHSYRRLLTHLDNIDFTYSILMDENRAADGIDLRYCFGYERDIPDPVIACELDNRPCSVLEMIVALCHRVEVHIMGNSEYGDRTGQWFWSIIRNMELMDMYDANYDEEYVDYCINRFLNREYNCDGSNGGLVYLPECRKDLRNVDIWYQMMWYLNNFV